MFYLNQLYTRRSNLFSDIDIYDLSHLKATADVKLNLWFVKQIVIRIDEISEERIDVSSLPDTVIMTDNDSDVE